jgi:dihydrofolate synthase/folylpolyglutamate synthase
LSGEHQRINAALAIATVKVLQTKIPVSEKQILDGLSKVNWPGRMQLVARASGQKILLDGAHNSEGAEVLRATLQNRNAFTLILGILGDKNCRAMCHILAPLAEKIFLVPVKSARTAAPDELAAICRQENPRALVASYASLSEALEKAVAESFVVIAGSLYLIGEAMELLQLSPAPERDEKGLNDWKTATNPGSGSA